MNESPYESKKTKINNRRFKAIFVNKGKGVDQQMREKERGIKVVKKKKLGRKMKNSKVESKEKTPIDAFRSFDKGVDMQFQYSAKASSAPFLKWRA